MPEYLATTTSEQHPGKRVNVQVDEMCLVLNALLRPDYPLLAGIAKARDIIRGDFLVTNQSGVPLFGILEEVTPELLGSKRLPSGLKRLEVARLNHVAPIFDYPWELVSSNSEMIKTQIGAHEFSLGGDLDQHLSADREIIGNGGLHVSETSTVEKYVTFDTTAGAVYLDDESIIESYSRITGPAYIGKSTRVKSARVSKGTSVGAHCILAGEVEESILFDYTNKSHDGFIGHSIMGSWVNLGAMTTNSDLKNTYGKVKVNLGGSRSHDTGMIKLGCFIGDMCKTAIGTSILSGKKVGVSSQVFGTVLEDVPSFTMYARSLSERSAEMYIESAVETQRRMMERRKVKMSEDYEKMIRSVFKMTAKDRRSGRVKKARFNLV